MLNIRVSRREFLKAVQIVENAVFDNKIREVLSGVYIVASGDRIYLRGTDLELSINSEIKGEVRSEGKIVIKHKIIEEFLKQINDEFIELIEEQGKIIIKADKTDTEFSIYNAESYPLIPKLELGVNYIFNKEKLMTNIEKVKISASKHLKI